LKHNCNPVPSIAHTALINSNRCNTCCSLQFSLVTATGCSHYCVIRAKGENAANPFDHARGHLTAYISDFVTHGYNLTKRGFTIHIGNLLLSLLCILDSLKSTISSSQHDVIATTQGLWIRSYAYYVKIHP
jgi:hypothetical protein